MSSRRLGLSKNLLHKPQVTFSDEILAVVDLVIREFKINDATAATTPQNLHT